MADIKYVSRVSVKGTRYHLGKFSTKAEADEVAEDFKELVLLEINEDLPLKVCKQCGTEAYSDSDLELFKKDKSKTHGRRNICKSCDNKRTSVAYYKNKEKHKEYGRKKHLKSKYGLTVECYDKMLKSQDNQCEICKIHVSELAKPLYIDHCHSTGKVRGLLCQHCNSGLGHFRDNIDSLLKASQYLVKYSKEGNNE